MEIISKFSFLGESESHRIFLMIRTNRTMVLFFSLRARGEGIIDVR